MEINLVVFASERAKLILNLILILDVRDADSGDLSPTGRPISLYVVSLDYMYSSKVVTPQFYGVPYLHLLLGNRYIRYPSLGSRQCEYRV